MAKYAVVDTSQSPNLVINVIEYNGTDTYTYPQANTSLIESDLGSIDDKYENDAFYYYDDWTDPQNPVWVERT